MTRDTKYVCDGCGTESTDNSQWSHPYFPNYGNKDLCVFCTSRVANSLYDASGTAREVEIGRLQEAIKEAISEAQRANEENARLYKALEEAREANGAALHRAEIAEQRAQRAEEEDHAGSQIIQGLHEELKEARYDAGLSEHEHRALVLELLNMLGKKAQRRNKKRLREIRLMIAEDAEPDFLDEIMTERGLGGDS